MSSPHSLRIKTAGTEVETAPQGADPVDDSAVSPEQRNAPSESPAGRKAVAPLVARFLPDLDKYQVVDANDLVVTRPIIGEHSAKAILTTLQRYVLGGGLCLKHLTELYAGRCLSCSQGWMRHTFSAEAR